MTVVEFFDNDAIENVISTLLCAPEKVIFVGDKINKMKKAVSNYKELAAARKLNVDFFCAEINRNNLMNIVSVLDDIINNNDECTFDLAGGEDLYLVAVGIVYGKYPEKVQLHRFNILNGKLYDCDSDGNLLSAKEAEISVEENIKTYGGRVIFEDERQDTTHNWSWDQEFTDDVMNMWEICKADTGKWNIQINTLEAYNQSASAKQSLDAELNKSITKLQLKKKEVKAVYISGMFKALERKRLITNLKISDDTISFRYKNNQVKRCLTKAGQILELFVTFMASMAVDRENTKIYNDVMTGVYIDWDGVVKNGEPNVDNEIDVLLMQGLVPIFISCKNGYMEVDELYKLNTVAERFGGKYAKKILIASELNKLKNGEYIMARANDMGIKVIDDITKISDVKIGKVIKNL